MNKYRHGRARGAKLNSDNAKKAESIKNSNEFEFKIILFHPSPPPETKKEVNNSFEKKRNQINVKTI